jgi:hypothetical protein
MVNIEKTMETHGLLSLLVGGFSPPQLLIMVN